MLFLLVVVVSFMQVMVKKKKDEWEQLTPSYFKNFVENTIILMQKRGLKSKHKSGF